MENKEYPELEGQELHVEESVFPSDFESPEQETVVEDFFADILPDQPVAEEDAFPMEAPSEEEPDSPTEEHSVDDYVAAIDEQIAADHLGIQSVPDGRHIGQGETIHRQVLGIKSRGIFHR